MDEEQIEDDIEEEMERVEEEIKEPKKVSSKKVGKAVKEEKPTERYVAFYQEARVGIVDTITNEVVVEGLRDLPTASLEALKLNKLDKIEVVSGV